MKILPDMVCTQCGCLCDDIELSVDGNRIVAAKRACGLGKPWFLTERGDDTPACLIDGRAASVEDGLDRAARVLQQAKYPLVFGLVDQTCEAQRAAVGIADWIGACIAPAGAANKIAATLAMQNVGKVTASLGEVAQRADVVVFWRTDPAQTHPRHLVRYSLLPKGLFTPNGRQDRTCVVIDTQATKTSQAADRFLQIDGDKEIEVLSILRAIIQGIEIDADIAAHTGVSLERWQVLAELMRGAKYGALFYETGAASTSIETARLESLYRLTRELNDHARFVAIANLGAGNIRGAENVLAWRTGYPAAVDFSRGYPRYGPDEYSAEAVLARREVAAALIVGERGIAELSDQARKHLASIPCVVLAEQPSTWTQAASVSFHIATDGIQAGGTMFRMDGVALPVRAAITTSRPSAQNVLEGIESRISLSPSPSERGPG